MKRLFILLLFASLSGCSPSSICEYRTEGEEPIKRLIYELSQIETVGQLEAREGRLKKCFSSLVDLMIAAKKFQAKRHDEGGEVTFWQLELSEALRREMIRIYEIEGCSELMEEIERDALHKLDIMERCY